MNDFNETKDVQAEEMRRAAQLLHSGGVVAFPTETYYGLAVDPFNESALARLFLLKKRAVGKPVLSLIQRPEDLMLFVRNVPSPYKPLMEKYWPGPLTLVFEARDGLPALLTGNTGTVGLRISSHPVARLLVKAFGGPVTATSANISNCAPASTPEEVRQQLGDGVDMVITGGETRGRVASTIVGISQGSLVLLRDGAVPGADIFPED